MAFEDYTSSSDSDYTSDSDAGEQEETKKYFNGIEVHEEDLMFDRFFNTYEGFFEQDLLEEKDSHYEMQRQGFISYYKPHKYFKPAALGKMVTLPYVPDQVEVSEVKEEIIEESVCPWGDQETHKAMGINEIQEKEKQLAEAAKKRALKKENSRKAHNREPSRTRGGEYHTHQKRGDSHFHHREHSHREHSHREHSHRENQKRGGEHYHHREHSYQGGERKKFHTHRESHTHYSNQTSEPPPKQDADGWQEAKKKKGRKNISFDPNAKKKSDIFFK